MWRDRSKALAIHARMGFALHPDRPLKLLEREHDLRTLATALDDASAGHGRIVLVGGEAGIGKTSFVEHFVAARGAPPSSCAASLPPDCRAMS